MKGLADCFAVKIPGASSKQTTPNPKCLALQQGYNGVSNKSYVQVSEPILLDTWQHNYAIGPSQMSLFLTFGSQYLKDLAWTHLGRNSGSCTGV